MNIAFILSDKDLEMLPWKNFGYQIKSRKFKEIIMVFY